MTIGSRFKSKLSHDSRIANYTRHFRFQT